MTDDQDKHVDIDFSAAEEDFQERDYQEAPRERSRPRRGVSPGKVLLWGGGAFVFLLLLAFLFAGDGDTPGEGEQAALWERLEKTEARLDALASQSEDAIRYLREEVYTLTKKIEILEKKAETPAARTVEKKASPTAVKPAVSASPAAGGKTYTVQRGDTLYGIARKHGLSVGELTELNGISPNKAIYPGDRLTVP